MPARRKVSLELSPRESYRRHFSLEKLRIELNLRLRSFIQRRFEADRRPSSREKEHRRP
jgi:hypothetical protein